MSRTEALELAYESLADNLDSAREYASECEDGSEEQAEALREAAEYEQAMERLKELYADLTRHKRKLGRHGQQEATNG